jgi:prophage antirepressor-like protein
MDSQQIQVFDFSNSEIRTITTPEGEVYFVASDVCKVLDLENVSKAVSRLDDDEKSILTLSEYGRDYEKPIISESGLYSLVLSSRKPEAKAFKKWITSEVLPTLRKTGKFETAPKSRLEMIAEAFANMAVLERQQLALEQEQKATESRVDVIEAKLETHNADFFSLAGYYGLMKWKWDLTNKNAQSVGKQLKALSETMGYAVLKMRDARFGEINTYHKAVLEQYFTQNPRQ